MSTPPIPPSLAPFPASQLFTFLPDIYALLTRIELFHSPQTQQEQQQSTSPQTTDPTNIRLPDLAAATHPIRQSIQKARAAVQALPDVDRTVDEQEDEIRGLEIKIVALKERLGLLGRLAAGESVSACKEALDNELGGGDGGMSSQVGQEDRVRRNGGEDVNMAGT